MNYGRIRRGPMAADAFTQIRNVLFRDPRLSFRDKGIFGLISTHRDGFGVTAESIAACSSADGVSAVKTSLRSLERYGYLKRTRERRPDGTLGGAVYFITDQPELFEGPETGNARSQPAVPQPPLAGPTQVEPTVVRPVLAEPAVVNHPHKKINSKKNRLGEDHPPSPPPEPAPPEAPPATENREGGRADAALTETEQHAADALTRITAAVPQLVLGAGEIARLAPLAVPWLERTTEARLSEALTAGLPSVVGSPVGIVRRRLLDKVPAAVMPVQAVRGGLPPWCGRCGDGMPAAEFNARFRVRADGALCGCHPDAVPA